jgi:hypothetical protein
MRPRTCETVGLSESDYMPHLPRHHSQFARWCGSTNLDEPGFYLTAHKALGDSSVYNMADCRFSGLKKRVFGYENAFMQGLWRTLWRRGRSLPAARTPLIRLIRGIIWNNLRSHEIYNSRCVVDGRWRYVLYRTSKLAFISVVRSQGAIFVDLFGGWRIPSY